VGVGVLGSSTPDLGPRAATADRLDSDGRDAVMGGAVGSSCSAALSIVTLLSWDWYGLLAVTAAWAGARLLSLPLYRFSDTSKSQLLSM
jgi:hypothetical protein